MSENDVLIRSENVSKKFCRDLKKSLWYGVQDMVADFLPSRPAHKVGVSATVHDGSQPAQSHLRTDEFWAVKDLCFSLRRGECLGLIGHNGAGKTTLLKLLNGLIKPDEGRIQIRGRVGALIALGAGFNPILTGRENIYINAAVLGLSKRETEDRLRDIIEFADIGTFIDSPVQSYSSGMAVRLGFAIATALRPDVLLLDEILAVGDGAFQAKCFNVLAEFQKQGTAFILVSHNMRIISRLSQRALYLKD